MRTRPEGDRLVAAVRDPYIEGSVASERAVRRGTTEGTNPTSVADAARATGGKIVSLELSQRKVDHARAQLARDGLADFVEFCVGSALDWAAAWS